jgi:hypothetical protein
LHPFKPAVSLAIPWGAMSATISLTEAQTLTALRSVLLALMPAGIEIFRAQVNRVPMPIGPDFIEMTPVMRERLATNYDTYTDTASPSVHVQQAMQSTQVTVQLDIFGPASADNAQIISTMFRDTQTSDVFAETGLAVQALYAGEPHETPFINGEQQFEYRWVVDVVLQANPIVTTPQQFADELIVGIINVDVQYMILLMTEDGNYLADEAHKILKGRII